MTSVGETLSLAELIQRANQEGCKLSQIPAGTLLALFMADDHIVFMHVADPAQSRIALALYKGGGRAVVGLYLGFADGLEASFTKMGMIGCGDLHFKVLNPNGPFVLEKIVRIEMIDEEAQKPEGKKTIALLTDADKAYQAQPKTEDETSSASAVRAIETFPVEHRAWLTAFLEPFCQKGKAEILFLLMCALEFDELVEDAQGRKFTVAKQRLVQEDMRNWQHQLPAVRGELLFPSDFVRLVKMYEDLGLPVPTRIRGA